MLMPRLLAVVEVDYNDRVRCNAAGCGHSVYRRIHIVRENDVTTVMGSDCYRKLVADFPAPPSRPRYGSSKGRRLTDEERQLLIQNTDRLIEQFEAEEQADLVRLSAIPQPPTYIPRQPMQPPISYQPQRPIQAPPSYQPQQSPETSTGFARGPDYVAQAKKILREKYPGVNIDLPGWHGLVVHEVRKLRKKHGR